MFSRAKIVLVGGGTGGHFYPLMSVAETLRMEEHPPKLYYVGPTSYDDSALQMYDISYVWCPAGKRRKYFSPLNFFDFFKTVAGVFVALYKLFIIYPDVVFSKGGYTSVPVVFAAWLLRIPIIVHESDSLPGVANKLGGKFAQYVAISYPSTAQFFNPSKTILTGIPIRSELLVPSQEVSRASLGIQSDLPLILILGGSQGAERINQLILDSLDELLPKYEIIHQTGKSQYDITVMSAGELIPNAEHVSRYHPTPFLTAHQLNNVMHMASLIISRAGSGTIHEIAVHEKPSILIPIPEAISHDQITNAYTYAQSGGAVVMEEQNLKDGLLLPEIDRIMQDSSVYSTLEEGARAFAKRDAAPVLSRIIMNITAEH